jgi:hypothetical protein
LNQFATPKTPREARERISAIKQEIQRIEAQLANPRVERKGVKLSTKRYIAWRKNAVSALYAKQLELGELKEWINEWVYRKIATKHDIDPGDPEELLLAASNIFKGLRIEGVAFTDAETEIIDLITAHVHGIAP